MLFMSREQCDCCETTECQRAPTSSDIGPLCTATQQQQHATQAGQAAERAEWKLVMLCSSMPRVALIAVSKTETETPSSEF